METRLFTEDVGKAKSMIKDMVDRIPADALGTDGKPLKDAYLARLSDSKDDPEKLQALYSDLTKFYGIKTTDERGVAWLDLADAGKKHGTVVSLYYAEKFPQADASSEKNHAVFGIRFAGAKMYFDEKMMKDGYESIGTKVFAP